MTSLRTSAHCKKDMSESSIQKCFCSVLTAGRLSAWGILILVMQIGSLPVAASAVAPAGPADFRSSVFSTALVARGQMAPAGVLVVADESDSAIAGLLVATTSPVVRIGREPDPLATLTGEIAARRPRTLHFVSHGEPGRVHLGTAVLDTALVRARAAELRSWGVRRSHSGAATSRRMRSFSRRWPKRQAP